MQPQGQIMHEDPATETPAAMSSIVVNIMLRRFMPVHPTMRSGSQVMISDNRDRGARGTQG